MSDDFSILQKKRRGYRGCLVAAWVIIIIFAGLSLYLTRQPFYKPYEECSKNCIVNLIPALNRYYDKNSRYPDTLEELQKDYLKDKDSIYCPSKSKHKYEYHKPSSPDYAGPVISCKEHVISGKRINVSFDLRSRVSARVMEE
ncbi:MAG: hypothetical protein IK083_08385 [Abditibacteriota bacterium]|nr:hypothetical protein [Abditibacteriota bacterium]